MRKTVIGLLVISLLSVVPAAYAAKVTPGTSCKKAGAQERYNGKVYSCIKLGKKLYWDNGKKISPSSANPSSQPSAATSSTPSPSPSLKQLHFLS